MRRLKKGPANIPEEEFINLGGTYNDEDFSMPDSLWFDGYEDYNDEVGWTNDIADGTWSW